MKSALPLNQNELETSASEDASIEEVCENFCESDDSLSEEDLELMKSLGFHDAIKRRTDPEDFPESDDDEDFDAPPCPSQIGIGAVMREYSRMGISWGDD